MCVAVLYINHGYNISIIESTKGLFYHETVSGKQVWNILYYYHPRAIICNSENILQIIQERKKSFKCILHHGVIENDDLALSTQARLYLQSFVKHDIVKTSPGDPFPILANDEEEWMKWCNFQLRS